MAAGAQGDSPSPASPMALLLRTRSDSCGWLRRQGAKLAAPWLHRPCTGGSASRSVAAWALSPRCWPPNVCTPAQGTHPGPPPHRSFPAHTLLSRSSRCRLVLAARPAASAAMPSDPNVLLPMLTLRSEWAAPSMAPSWAAASADSAWLLHVRSVRLVLCCIAAHSAATSCHRGCIVCGVCLTRAASRLMQCSSAAAAARRVPPATASCARKTGSPHPQSDGSASRQGWRGLGHCVAGDP